MNIVLEGCDGTGKTALAKYLCEQLGMYYWHESEPKSLGEYQTMLNPGGVVFDRFCLGQFVYNKPKERHLTEKQLQFLCNEIFPKTNTILIYVDLSSEEIVKRLISRGEGTENDKADMLKWVKNIRGTYMQLLRENHIKYIVIDGGKGQYV